MKHHDDDLHRLRAWLIEDTGSEAEANRLLPVVERLRRLSDLGDYLGAQTALSSLPSRELHARQPEPRSQRTVVYIDDDAAVIDLASLVLKTRGFEVFGATSGSHGLELVFKVKPDLVLLDLMMPEMDGWDVYQCMKADETIRTVPVIVVTAKAQNIDKALGLNIAKVEDYITKPFSSSELVKSISRVLGDAA
jgi:CheY-like chemotaxis protein